MLRMHKSWQRLAFILGRYRFALVARLVRAFRCTGERDASKPQPKVVHISLDSGFVILRQTFAVNAISAPKSPVSLRLAQALSRAGKGRERKEGKGAQIGRV
jgi:hypothetical protein